MCIREWPGLRASVEGQQGSQLKMIRSSLPVLGTALRIIVFSTLMMAPVAAFAAAQVYKEPSRSVGLVILVSLQRA